MRNRVLFLLLIGSIIFQSCSRAMTPYDAANHPRGKKCATIK
ncbi:MAG TPA: hypothetical protein PLO70_00340 [Chitinophagaceae bacterium]|nr:hypothetical protein [Chitinophagaceae bacterium]HQZ72926.1 hypothetical protein [Chitinophagaceae bacterium]